MLAATRPITLVDEGLGNSSYLVDLGDGRALVVDPERDPGPYLAAAQRGGLAVAYAAETHLHVVSGSRELAARRGIATWLLGHAADWHPHQARMEPDIREELMTHLTVLAVPGCPNAAVLGERLARVLGSRRDVTVSRHVIADENEAARRGMHGSPTILVDGIDPFAGPGQPASVSCRLYRDSDGRPDGAPSVTQLRQAIGESQRHQAATRGSSRA